MGWKNSYLPVFWIQNEFDPDSTSQIISYPYPDPVSDPAWIFFQLFAT
jgi:hypothetical protein